MEIPKWDSSKIIGRIKERHAKLERKRLDYRSFYNGWIEGRIDMLIELRGENYEHTSENSLHKHGVTNCPLCGGETTFLEHDKCMTADCPNCVF